MDNLFDTSNLLIVNTIDSELCMTLSVVRFGFSPIELYDLESEWGNLWDLKGDGKLAQCG